MLLALQFFAGLAALVVGAEVLVRGASQLAVRAGISPLVVGLTVVAIGTSAPEMAVSVQASLAGNPDIAVGNVVGSNIANILLILGFAALISPLKVSQQVVRFEVPIMIGVSFLLFALARDGALSLLDGLLLLFIYVAYTGFVVRKSRKETRAAVVEYREELEAMGWQAHWSVQVGFIVAGLALLVFGAHWMVEAAVDVARRLGFGELVIALTVVAVGTSLPEVATSLMASRRDQDDIAVGNAVGSNIANLTLVLGVSAVAAQATGVNVAREALAFDLPVMVAVAVACLPIFFYNFALERWEGGVFFGYFVAYLAYQVLYALAHPALPLVSQVMGVFVLPLTVLTFAVVIWRVRRGGAALS